MSNLWLETIGLIIGNTVQFLLIPIIWWIIFYRKKQNFPQFIGLTRPKLNSIWLLFGFFVIYFLHHRIDLISLFERISGVDELAISENIAEIHGNEAIQGNMVAGMGLAALIPTFILTMYANGLCEEAFFRGFVLKRFKKLLGTWASIIIAGVLFSLLHNVMFLLVGIEVSFLHHLGMFLSITISGILFGVLNEIVFDGNSIVPSVLLHGLANFFVTAQSIIHYR